MLAFSIQGRLRPQAQDGGGVVCPGGVSFILPLLRVLWPGAQPSEDRALRNGEVKGDGRPGGTEAPLFGAQASLGKGRV